MVFAVFPVAPCDKLIMKAGSHEPSPAAKRQQILAQGVSPGSTPRDGPNSPQGLRPGLNCTAASRLSSSELKEMEAALKIGLSPLQGQASFEETLRECEQAEAAGFDSIWLGEHHNHPVLYPAPLIGLAAVASRTRSIRLGTGVLLLPLYHPVMVAEEGAMVDVISGGRLILGIGAGYAPEEFAAFGYSVKERGSRLEESASLLQRLWTEENVTHRGRHYQVNNDTGDT